MAASDARRMAILELVRTGKVVRVADLSRQFGVSEVSVRRDLGWLEECGLLKRVHGGAVASSSAMPYDEDGNTPHLEEKQRIGRAAAQLVRPGERIILDSGTTVREIARQIAAQAANLQPLTVITASLRAFRELSLARGLGVIVLGGIYLPDFQTLVGPQTVAALQDLHVDKLFLGADGLSLAHGITSANVLEAEASRAMARAAAETIVVADSSKINSAGLATIIPLARIHTLITDCAAPPEFVAALEQQGVKVVLV